MNLGVLLPVELDALDEVDDEVEDLVLLVVALLLVLYGLHLEEVAEEFLLVDHLAVLGVLLLDFVLVDELHVGDLLLGLLRGDEEELEGVAVQDGVFDEALVEVDLEHLVLVDLVDERRVEDVLLLRDGLQLLLDLAHQPLPQQERREYPLNVSSPHSYVDRILVLHCVDRVQGLAQEDQLVPLREVLLDHQVHILLHLLLVLVLLDHLLVLLLLLRVLAERLHRVLVPLLIVLHDLRLLAVLLIQLYQMLVVLLLLLYLPQLLVLVFFLVKLCVLPHVHLPRCQVAETHLSVP